MRSIPSDTRTQRSLHIYRSVGLVAVSAALAWLYSEPSGVALGVRVGGKEVSGLATFGDTRTALAKRYDLHRRLTVRVGHEVLSATPDQIGSRVDVDRTAARAWIDGRQNNLLSRSRSHWRVLRGESVDIAPVPVVDEARLRRFLDRIHGPSKQEAARAVERDGGWVLPGANARIQIDPVLGQQVLQSAILAGSPEVELPTRGGGMSSRIASPPSGTPALGASGAVETLHTAASVRQDFHSKAPQARHNIRLAARMLEGVVVEPGERFRFNTAVGPRTTERGFRNAPAFRGRAIVDDLGGGVCGVSSLVYQAALISGLPIIERHNHTFRTSAFPLDAMVDYPSRCDLSFLNSTGAPLVLSARMQGDVCRVSLLTYRVLAVVRVETEKRAPRPGRLRVVTWRTFRLSDGSIRREKTSEGVYRLEHPARRPLARRSRR